jgi:hypothetical protein
MGKVKTILRSNKKKVSQITSNVRKDYKMSPSGKGKRREKNIISRCPATNPPLSFISFSIQA